MQNLLNFYKAQNHEDVISLIEDGVDVESKFDMIASILFKLYIPKGLDLSEDKLPLLTAHTDTVFIDKPDNFNIDKTHRGTRLTSATPGSGIGGDCRNGCYLISQVMKSASWDKFIYVLFDLEENGAIGAQTMPFQDVIADNVSYLIGLDCFDKDYIAVYQDTDRDLISSIADNFDNKIVTRAYFTDVVVLADTYDLSAIVLSVGFYNQHSPQEYVIYEDLAECYDTIIKFGNLEITA